jgi:hypothetical protein
MFQGGELDSKSGCARFDSVGLRQLSTFIRVSIKQRGDTMRTKSEEKQITALMLMEMFLDGDERGARLIEAAHSYVQSSVMQDVDVSDDALYLTMVISGTAVNEGVISDYS